MRNSVLGRLLGAVAFLIAVGVVLYRGCQVRGGGEGPGTEGRSEAVEHPVDAGIPPSRVLP